MRKPITTRQQKDREKERDILYEPEKSIISTCYQNEENCIQLLEWKANREKKNVIGKRLV